MWEHDPYKGTKFAAALAIVIGVLILAALLVCTFRPDLCG